MTPPIVQDTEFIDVELKPTVSKKPVIDASQKVFILRHENAELVLHLSEAMAQLAEQLKTDFLANHAKVHLDCTRVDLLLLFVEYIVKHDLHKDLLKVTFNELAQGVLGMQNPHCALAVHLKALDLKKGLRIYYEAAKALSQPITHPKPAIFSETKAKLSAIFGGQGNSTSHFGELEELISVYEPLIHDFAESFFVALKEVALDARYSPYLEKGFNVTDWIRKPFSKPNDDYLSRSCISLPLVGLLHLLNYCVLLRCTGLDPQELLKGFVTATGHSQGIISALVISASHNVPELMVNGCKALRMLFYIGLQAELAFPKPSISPKALSTLSVIPTPMLSVNNVSRGELEKLLQETGQFLDGVEIGLVNGPKSFVCCGPPHALHGLYAAIERVKAGSEDQSRVPHSERKKKLTARFLPISSPFHYSKLAAIKEKLIAEIKANGDSLDDLQLELPLTCPHSGVLTKKIENVDEYLVESICVRQVDWNAATSTKVQPGTTHFVDFGPGGPMGIGLLTHRIREGSGVQVILASSNQGSESLQGRCEFLSSDAQSIRFGINWEQQFAPKLVQRACDGKLFVETKFSSLIGKPPLMVAGMTPTTVSTEINVACAQAGYHVELAGGGHFTEGMLMDKITEIESQIPAGTGITLNSLFLNPRLWALQYPLMCRMRKEGHPIEGFTIAAGVPSLENANEIITNMKEAGIKHVSFKPGSIASIFEVVEIAKNNADFPVVLQWTGGRGGGHHSFEDFHQPILETYSMIRSQKNIVLVAGSGFGDGAESLPYLTGEWSVKYGVSPMPFDGILLGSRMMVSKESKLSSSAKELLLKAKGVTDELEWEKSYKGAIGGIVTVRSELGEPIHKVATRAVLFWKELDDILFTLPKDKRPAVIANKRNYIIDRLNSDHQKVWFPKKLDGKVHIDIADMTYEEVLVRLVELCYIQKENRWIDQTYKQLILNFVLCIQQRFGSQSEAAVTMSAIDKNVANVISERNPRSKAELLMSEDVAYFLQICSNPVMKPVPFVPVLDDNFEWWFKKDSLWASEDVSAIPESDPQRVCILQGPVAVRHSQTMDESCQEILDGINNYYVKQLSNKQKPKTVSWLGNGQDWFTELAENETVMAINGNQKKLTFNFVRQVLRKSVCKRTSPNEFVLEQDNKVVLSASHKDNGKIEVTLYYHLSERIEKLTFHYTFDPKATICKIFLLQDNLAVNHFYWRVWFPNDNSKEVLNMNATLPWDALIECRSVILQDEVDAFCRTVKNNSPAYQGTGVAPMDFLIVASWPAVIKLLFTKGICDENLLNLVHLSNRFKAIQSEPLRVGDEIVSKGKLLAYKNLNGGKLITVEATVYKAEQPVASVESQFFVRDSPCASEYLFERKMAEYTVPVTEDLFMAIQYKPWIKVSNARRNVDLSRLRVELESVEKLSKNELKVQGQVFGMLPNRTTVSVGSIEYNGQGSGNPVREFFERHQVRTATETLFEDAVVVADESHWMHSQLQVLTNQSNAVYSRVSGDHNPIHTSEVFALLAGLKAPITHGMWSSAACKAVAEAFTSDNKPERLVEWGVEFLGMVLPGDTLQVSFAQTGIRQGRKLMRAIVTRTSDSAQVLKATYEVKPPLTAFVFTGQGSQSMGMGMDLYETSAVARAVWDQAEKHFMGNYGISILDIVRKNPTSYTVYFGGKRGQLIKRNYQRMTVEVIEETGTSVQPLFPEIDDEAEEFTFRTPQGLLNATQFTQPALVLYEKAAYEDMRSKGLIGTGMPFAGHSLGEYASLAAIGNVIEGEALCDIVFFRGLTMQRAVKRDAHGRSSFGMIAVNPSRVHPTFDQEAMQVVVQAVVQHSPRRMLLEIVNYNIDGQQYVVSGELTALECLTQFLNFVYAKKIDVNRLKSQMSEEKIKEHMAEIVQGIFQEKCTQPVLEVSKGISSIPLAGIDVPFHSSFLLPGVPAFRSILQKKLQVSDIIVSGLEGKYVPNLMGIPFWVSREFLEKVYSVSGSNVVKELLDNWNEMNLQDASKKQAIAHALLIELLAFQFASPVQWIKTQDCMFRDLGVDNVVEIGPAPILAGMAARTLKLKYATHDAVLMKQRRILSYQRDLSELYPSTTTSSPSPTPGVNAEKTLKVDVEKKPTVAETKSEVIEEEEDVSSGPQQEYSSLPFKALDSLKVIIGYKLKSKNVSVSKSIKDLSAGKSTLQNELFGELVREFGDGKTPEKSEEMPLEELATAIDAKLSEGFLPGKQLQQQVGKLITAKMPPGMNMSAIEAVLKTKYGFVQGQATMAILAYSLLHEPDNRLADDSAVQNWLAAVVSDFGKEKGLSFTSSGGKKTKSAGVRVSTEELKRLEEQQKEFARMQLQTIARYLGETGLELQKLLDTKTEENRQVVQQLDLWIKEHGVEYGQGIQPHFDARKVRAYNAYWNWAKQDALELLHDILRKGINAVDRRVMERCIHLLNCSHPALVDFFEYHLQRCSAKVEFLQEKGPVIMEHMREALSHTPFYKDVSQPLRPHTEFKDDGSLEYKEVPRPGVNKLESYVEEVMKTCGGGSKKKASAVLWNKKQEHERPWLYLCKREKGGREWKYSKPLTLLYLEALRSVAANGITFENRNALVTGCGRGSIGLEMVKALLAGGARVVVTTSSYSKSTLDMYRDVYRTHGARGSSLIVVPFNAASHQDVKGLVDFVFDKLGLELDYLVPFAAISELGRDISKLDERSELAHRAMLTNVLRLIGCVAEKKRQRGMYTRPATVILPMSPNHGVFGGDGLYGESKAALEPLMNRWHSEAWGEYVGVIGAVIGWTRGTGLMSENNLVAESIEAMGVRTFSTTEMAFNLVSLLHRGLVNKAQQGPVWAELSGGLGVNANTLARKCRTALMKQAKVNRIRFTETNQIKSSAPATITKKALMEFGFSPAPFVEEFKEDAKLRALLDLKRVIVVTGYGEVGPWGNSRTRWDLESKYAGGPFSGLLSLESVIELAWSMGLIELSTKAPIIGWYDTKTKEHVPDHQITAKYEKYILEHCGIRTVEPELFHGYDPANKQITQEIILNNELGPFEASAEEAQAYVKCHKDKIDVRPLPNGRFQVTLLKGCTLFVPKTIFFDRTVAGQRPTGWSAERFGVPEDICRQVDPTTLYVLVAASEALLASGITDPYELYSHVHVSQVGNTIGGGEGGMYSNKLIFRNRFLDLQCQNDILQESFINTIPAWLNMLLLSSSGPIRTPVGACATAVASIDSAVDLLLNGKAEVVLAGGYDDFGEEGSYEFGMLKATSSSVDEYAQGREPSEMCRPTADTRGGFMESQGAGVQVLMTAETALRMGVPIYGIIAASNTASDKASRSVPAPGQGILTTARKNVAGNSGEKSPLLDKNYRFNKLTSAQCSDETTNKLLRNYWGHDFAKGNPEVAPLEAALATYGLGIDDVGIASFHGTGTKANDLNESHVVHQQLKHLGRTKGNAIACVFQKSLTGHPKGAAASWMVNGALQAMNSGIIPANGNADNVDPALEAYGDLLFFPCRPIDTRVQGGIKAAVVKSFGFGQVGGEVLLVRPDILFSTLSPQEYTLYAEKVKQREHMVKRYWQESILSTAAAENRALVRLKNSPPYEPQEASAVYLNPLARLDPSTKKFITAPSPNSGESEKDQLACKVQTLAKQQQEGALVAVDVQLIKDFPISNVNFITDNFTDKERAQLDKKPDAAASYAGRWAAKEAIYKALSSQGTTASLDRGHFLKSIEVLNDAAGVPICASHAHLQVSISHSGDYAVAIASILPSTTKSGK